VCTSSRVQWRREMRSTVCSLATHWAVRISVLLLEKFIYPSSLLACPTALQARGVRTDTVTSQVCLPSGCGWCCSACDCLCTLSTVQPGARSATQNESRTHVMLQCHSTNNSYCYSCMSAHGCVGWLLTTPLTTPLTTLRADRNHHSPTVVLAGSSQHLSQHLSQHCVPTAIITLPRLCWLAAHTTPCPLQSPLSLSSRCRTAPLQAEGRPSGSRPRHEAPALMQEVRCNTRARARSQPRTCAFAATHAHLCVRRRRACAHWRKDTPSSHATDQHRPQTVPTCLTCALFPLARHHSLLSPHRWRWWWRWWCR
jgi:hypothetical protein